MRQILVTVMSCLSVLFVSASAADEHGAKRPLTDAEAVAGKPLYLAECNSCHGERGDGAGPAADYIEPRPRDFAKGRFKLRSTESGHPPTTNDVLRTIQLGIPGTAMPPFAFLAVDERKSIAAYVLKLAGLLDQPEPAAIKDPGPPPPMTPESIARGKTVYADSGCPACHGELGKGDGQSAGDLKDADGRSIKPRDFTAGLYRGGNERRDIFYRLATGMDGTPMPSYTESIDPPELWAVTDYIVSLRLPPIVKPRPSDPIAAGREVVAKYSCQGCHRLDDGKGGDVGPDLRTTTQTRSTEWIGAFLKVPRLYGHLNPARVYRMPALDLSEEEVEVVTKYLLAIAKRKDEA